MHKIAQAANILGGWSAAHADLSFSFLVTAAMRVWFAAWGVVVIVAHGSLIVPNPPSMYLGLPRVPDQGFSLVLAPWQRWDGMWYLRIAEFGYAPNDASASFFPSFSLFTRVLTFLVPNYLLASLIVSTAASFFAFLFLYRLGAELTDAAAARRAVIYLALFPTAFFLFAPYAESVLLASSLAAVYYARRGRWQLASLAGAVATLARPVGFLIAVPLAIETYKAGGNRLRAAAAVGGLVGAMAVWMLYLQVVFGDALLWVHAEDLWQRIFVIPGQTILWTVQDILSGQGAVGNNVVDLGLTAIAVAAIVAAWRKQPPSLSAYALLMIAVPLLNYAQYAGYALAPMAAAGRRVLVAFPAIIALAMVWEGKWKEPLWIICSAVIQLFLFISFVQWLWVD